MGKAMKRRKVVRALFVARCTVRSDRGAHTKWVCPCGQHSANVPRHAVISPGVVTDMIKRMRCLSGGWLQ
jgi:hypothetical protein